MSDYKNIVIKAGDKFALCLAQGVSITQALAEAKVRLILSYARWPDKQKYKQLFDEETAREKDDREMKVLYLPTQNRKQTNHAEDVLSSEKITFSRLPALTSTLEAAFYLVRVRNENENGILSAIKEKSGSCKFISYHAYAMTGFSERMEMMSDLGDLLNSTSDSVLRMTRLKRPIEITNGKEKAESVSSSDHRLLRSKIISLWHINDMATEENAGEIVQFQLIPADERKLKGGKALDGSEIFFFPAGGGGVVIPKADIEKAGVYHRISIQEGREYFCFSTRKDVQGVAMLPISGEDLIAELRKEDIRQQNKELVGRQYKLSTADEESGVFATAGGFLKMERQDGFIRTERFDKDYYSYGVSIDEYPPGQLIPTLEEAALLHVNEGDSLVRISSNRFEQKRARANRFRLRHHKK